MMLDPSKDWLAIDPWHTQMSSFRAIEQGFNLIGKQVKVSRPHTTIKGDS